MMGWRITIVQNKILFVTLVAASIGSALPATGQSMLPPPGFHHLHLNSTNPDAAIDFYTRQFPTTSKSSWGGTPALKSPMNVMVLFNKVDRPPTTEPQSAIWHFGWHVTDVRKTLATFKTRQDVKLLPLYTGDGGNSVLVSSDTWPGTGGVLGLTKAQIAEAKAKGVQPAGGGGFAYLEGPDGAIIEYQGNLPVERFNHVHMWQEEVFCAQLWYQRHLNAPVVPGRTSDTPLNETNCKTPHSPDRSFPALEPEGTYRVPRAGVEIGGVTLTWYARQGDQPLAPTRGQLYDHIGLSVADLDAWLAKLRGEGVKILAEPYRLGDTRALMIEGPSREAIELVEVK
jgi:catechol 2,3-dioxygenase-like lactoylglutathione lyase family enzyme